MSQSMLLPTNLTRRAMIGQSAALAAPAFALPYLIPAGVLAAPGKPGANDRIGVGYVGVGRRAQQLMKLPAEAQMVAVSDIYRDRAEKVAAAHKCRAYTDYRKLLESKDIDAVVVATPDHWHALPSIHACQAGKDVYCEKPLTLTIVEGRRMVEAARKYERVVQTGSQQRSMAANRTACELIRNGRIGKIQRVIGFNYPSPWNCALRGGRAPAGLDWDTWCGPTELRPFNQDIFTPRASPGWISFRAYSGGEMTGWGAHGLDQVQWALGTDESGPLEIWTEGSQFDPPTYALPESRRRGDTAGSHPTVKFRYAGGIILELANGPHGGAVFIGEHGKITIDRGKCKVEPEELAHQPAKETDVRLYVSDHHLQNWIDCIKSRKRPVADVEIGHRTATVCHLGNIARWTGRRLHWDPKKELFRGDDAANALLQRPRRKPFQLPEIA